MDLISGLVTFELTYRLLKEEESRTKFTAQKEVRFIELIIEILVLIIIFILNKTEWGVKT